MPGPEIVPSFTFSSDAGTPSFSAAAPSRISRASAQAKRTAVPLSCTDWLPAVWPSFGVSAVSPWMSAMRFRSTSSSSAAICAIAVPIPWPSSILPLKIVTLPSASMRSHAFSMRLAFRLPGSRAGGFCERRLSGAIEKPITSAPALMNLLLEMFMTSPSRLSAPRARCGCARRSGTGARSGPVLFRARWAWGFSQATPSPTSACRCRSSRTGRPAPR